MTCAVKVMKKVSIDVNIEDGEALAAIITKTLQLDVTCHSCMAIRFALVVVQMDTRAELKFLKVVDGEQFALMTGG